MSRLHRHPFQVPQGLLQLLFRLDRYRVCAFGLLDGAGDEAWTREGHKAGQQDSHAAQVSHLRGEHAAGDAHGCLLGCCQQEQLSLRSA